jgi:hypothetical protein
VVPDNFDEFYSRYPKYVINWAKKRLNSFVVTEDVEDWAQDLIIHMKYLPKDSKHRLPGANGRENGCEDVIQTFNPYQQYGASERRFRHYVNFCLANKFNTVYKKRDRNPLFRQSNLVLDNTIDARDSSMRSGIVNDEFCHLNSERLMLAVEDEEKHQADALQVAEFTEFVKVEDPTMIPVMEAIGSTATQTQAAALLAKLRGEEVSESEFNRLRNRLKLLGDCFREGIHAPKQRRSYKKAAGVVGVEIEVGQLVVD